MFQPFATIGAAPAGYAPAGMGFMPPSAQVGAMAPYRYYDIVGADTGAAEGTWDKIKKWGDEKTAGVQNKWLVLGAAVVGLAWYGHYKRWF